MLILKIWSEQPGKFFCLSTKDGQGNWRDHFFAREDFGKVRQFLRDHQDKDIYFCPHGFTRRTRQKEEAVLPKLLWADLDFANPATMTPKPTYAFESSPGRFVGLWSLKETMTESLNRRLTYAIDADHGGWDLTQVLRVPGTRNYKYKSQPRVRILWDDGKTWTTKAIERYLPEDDDIEEGVVHVSPSEVFEKYQDKLPRWARRELMAKTISGKVDRSEMLWKLENECLEAGMQLEEAFAILKMSVWNKFKGRRNEDQQLLRELRKATEGAFREKPRGAEKLHRKSDAEESEKEKYDSFLKFESMDDVEEQEVDFIWKPYLARGVVSILEGDPGLGKSYLAQMVAGSIATGRRIISPFKGSPKITGKTVYFDMENDAGNTTKPRLIQNGFTNLQGNYHVVQQPFSIDDEEAKEFVYENLERIKPDLIVFDTLNTYIGKADTHKASEVAQAFQFFMQLAKDFNCSVLVLRHLVKGNGAAIYRGQGSISFAGLARVVMCVGVDPDDTDTRAMAIVKINIGRAPPALTFRIEEREKGKSEFLWGEFVNLSAQEILDASQEARAEGKQGTGIQDAMEFLEATIKGVAIEVDRLYRMGEKRSVSRKMIDRAASKMQIKKITKKGVETWSLPEDKEE